MNFETLVRDMIALRKEYREKTRSGEVHTESDAIRSLLNVLIKRKERSGVTWKARELKEYRK